ncbi:MAG: endonuclease III [Leptospiraceae bacterium]|nr:endonuclease III [Leptospiraceae bacterium]
MFEVTGVVPKKQNLNFPFTTEVNKRLKKFFGFVSCPLHYKKDYELCIAVILSAQCTDERVNTVTPALFERFTNLEAFANAEISEIEKLIFSTGFYKNKAKSIQGFASLLIEKHAGKLPKTIAELIKLPGVGRKTANVILNEIHKISEGIVVDTHVKRISNVLKLTKSENPVIIEKDLMKKIERQYWMDFSLYLIFLGRKFCKAHKTECEGCPLNDICPSSLVVK